MNEVVLDSFCIHSRALHAAHLVKLAVEIVEGVVAHHHVLGPVVEVHLPVPVKVLRPVVRQGGIVRLGGYPQQVLILPRKWSIAFIFLSGVLRMLRAAMELDI